VIQLRWCAGNWPGEKKGGLGEIGGGLLALLVLYAYAVMAGCSTCYLVGVLRACAFSFFPFLSFLGGEPAWKVLLCDLLVSSRIGSWSAYPNHISPRCTLRAYTCCSGKRVIRRAVAVVRTAVVVLHVPGFLVGVQVARR
jgi:hypothetical protein